MKDYDPPMTPDDAARDARYYRERGRTDGRPNGYCKVWFRPPAEWRGGPLPSLAPAIADNPHSLVFVEIDPRYLRTRCERVAPRTMPEEWRRALCPQTLW